MGPLVDLEILRPGEDLAAAGVRARKWFLAGVHAYVVDELVLGFEGFALSSAALPQAGVRRELGPTHVLDRQVRHDVVHALEELTADLPRLAESGLLVDPHALSGLASSGGRVARGRRATVAGAAHVPEEGAVRVSRRWMVHVLLVWVDGGQVRCCRRRGEVLVVTGRRWWWRRQPVVFLGIVSRIVSGGRQGVLAGMVRELLHAAAAVVVQRCEESESALGRRGVGRGVELVLATHEEVAGRESGVMRHVVSHVRRAHVRAGMRVWRVALVVEVSSSVVLLRRGLAGRRLEGHRAAGFAGLSRRQFDTQTREVVRMRLDAVEEGVHHGHFDVLLYSVNKLLLLLLSTAGVRGWRAVLPGDDALRSRRCAIRTRAHHLQRRGKKTALHCVAISVDS